MRIEKPKHFFHWLASILLLALLLTACTQDKSEQLQGQLLIWHPFKGESAQLLSNNFKEFQQLNPDIDIISEYVPLNEIASRFIKQAKNGLGASIIIDLTRHIPKLVKAGYIQQIDAKAINLSAYFPQTLTQIRYQGKIYGVPLGSRIRVLCYNQAKTKQSSLKSDKSLTQPPTRLEGLIKRAQKGYSVGMVSTFEDTFWGMGVFGTKLFDSQGLIKPQLEGWAKWLEWLKGASTQPNFILLRERERKILHKAFAQGKLTYYVCDSSELSDLKNNLKDDLRVALLPQEPHRKATPILYTGVIMFNRNNSPNEMRLAIKLTKFMTNPEQQLQAIVQSQSFIPTHRSVRIDRHLLPIEAVLLEQAKTAVAIPVDDIEQKLAILERGELLYQQAIAGGITPSEAVEQLTAVVKQQENR